MSDSSGGDESPKEDWVRELPPRPDREFVKEYMRWEPDDADAAGDWESATDPTNFLVQTNRARYRSTFRRRLRHRSGRRLGRTRGLG